ncbi:MAG: MFS transporter [Oceanospirillaceae bacterium]|nr:MFS transporter [Oceanospirillaceae bacterium]
MTYPNFSQSSKVLLAAAMVSTVLGSIHAFSILLVPLETLFVATRSAVSLTYSFALVSLSIAVLLGHLFYGRGSPATFLMATCSLAAVGAVVAGMASSLWVVWFGYGVLFGVANGLGYGFGLQLAAQTYPGREGFSMGIVTAAYALGAVISPTLFNFILESLDFSAVMIALAVALLVVGLLSRVILTQVGATFRTDQQGDVSTSASHRSQLLLWVGYFGGVLAGLMVIGHSAGVAAWLQPGTSPWIAPMVIAFFNLLGSLVGGRLVDKIRPGGLLAVLAVITTGALISLVMFGKEGGLFISLSVIGFAYGGTIAAYPAAIAKLFHVKDIAKIYGRVFTAWGCAGLLGPWLAGFLFDLSTDYQLALLAAACFGLVSILAMILLSESHRHNFDA